MGLAASRPEFYKDPTKAAEHYAQMMNTPGAGRPELIPRSVSARFLQHPWGLIWRRVPAARYFVLSFTITLFVYKKIDDLGERGWWKAGLGLNSGCSQ